MNFLCLSLFCILITQAFTFQNFYSNDKSAFKDLPIEKQENQQYIIAHNATFNLTMFDALTYTVELSYPNLPQCKLDSKLNSPNCLHSSPSSYNQLPESTYKNEVDILTFFVQGSSNVYALTSNSILSFSDVNNSITHKQTVEFPNKEDLCSDPKFIYDKNNTILGICPKLFINIDISGATIEIENENVSTKALSYLASPNLAFSADGANGVVIYDNSVFSTANAEGLHLDPTISIQQVIYVSSLNVTIILDKTNNSLLFYKYENPNKFTLLTGGNLTLPKTTPIEWFQVLANNTLLVHKTNTDQDGSPVFILSYSIDINNSDNATVKWDQISEWNFGSLEGKSVKFVDSSEFYVALDKTLNQVTRIFLIKKVLFTTKLAKDVEQFFPATDSVWYDFTHAHQNEVIMTALVNDKLVWMKKDETVKAIQITPWTLQYTYYDPQDSVNFTVNVVTTNCTSNVSLCVQEYPISVKKLEKTEAPTNQSNASDTTANGPNNGTKNANTSPINQTDVNATNHLDTEKNSPFDSFLFIVIGGVVVLGILVYILCCCCRKGKGGGSVEKYSDMEEKNYIEKEKKRLVEMRKANTGKKGTTDFDF